MSEQREPYTAAPQVTPDGSQLRARRGSARRELFPSSWLRREVRIAYDDGSGTPGVAGEGDLAGVLLEWCGAGLIVQSNGSKKLLSWDRLVLVELVEDSKGGR